LSLIYSFPYFLSIANLALRHTNHVAFLEFLKSVAILFSVSMFI